MSQRKEAALDTIVAKIVSRKFLTWLTATALLCFSDLDSDAWVTISAIYIGGQTVIDGIAKLKG